MRGRETGSIVVSCALLVVLAAPAARAAEGPLLVVVEAPPELSVDAGQIRRAIGAELGDATVAPGRLVSETSERALIVSVDGERITMSLRDSATTPVVRSIPAPADAAARLRAIAWLGGNLARDQVTGIIAAAPPPAPPSPTEPPPAPAVTMPAPAPAPPAPPTPAPVEQPVSTITAAVDRVPARRSNWTIGMAAGPAISLYETGHVFYQSLFGSWNLNTSFPNIYRNDATLWRVEARRRTEGSRTFVGLSLEGMSNGEIDEIDETVGAMALTGSSLQWRTFMFEAVVGAGVDAHRPFVTLIGAGPDGRSFTSAPQVQPGLFAAGTLAVSHPLVDVVDWVVSVDAHMSVVDVYDGYLAATLGLRYRL